MSKLTLRIRFLTKINSGFRIVFNTRLENILQARGNNSVHGIHDHQGEVREGLETAIHRASPSVMRASRGVRRSNCKQIWLRVHDPSEGMLKLLLYKILLV